jgi:hypothetical protein
MKSNYLTLQEIVSVCSGHTELIKKEIADREKEALEGKGWLSFDKITDIRGYRGGKQYFAVDGSLATGLCTMENDDGNFWVPAILDGAVYSSYPDEGHGGIAHLCFLHKRENGQIINRWLVVWIDAGWLHKEEFENLLPVEISDVLADEILAGENVITKKPVGWA